tara:strand:- start:284 stop:1567 length:1284 start_codon:yes stop_codon:yes gene_type:complete
MQNLAKKIKSNKAIISVIGLGYVGLPLCKTLLEKKFTVFGFEKNQSRINDIENNKIKIDAVKNYNFTKKIKNKKFFLFKKFKKIKESDIIIICVPTPLKNNNPDLSDIVNVTKNILLNIKLNQLIILESSTYPGTTKNLIVNKILKKNIKIGKNYFVGYSPEREDPGNKYYSLGEINKVVSGYTNNCKNLTKIFYKKFINKIHVAENIETAEFSKLYENTYRNVNIALANEAKVLAEKIDLNIFDIIKCCKTKPFGFQAFYPGPGVGGHCIPIDPVYLSWLAKKNNFTTDIINLAVKINNYMPVRIVGYIKKYLKKNKKNRVFILGAAYKKDINDLRQSPIIKIINLFKKNKIKFIYNDNYIPILKSKKLNKNYKSQRVLKKNLKKFDTILLLTDHKYYDRNFIQKNSNMIFDTRNFFNKNLNLKIL